jgi:hypothetical protein
MIGDGIECEWFDDLPWRVSRGALRLGMRRLSIRAGNWLRWRTCYEPLGRRKPGPARIYRYPK